MILALKPILSVLDKQVVHAATNIRPVHVLPFIYDFSYLLLKYPECFIFIFFAPFYTIEKKEKKKVCIIIFSLLEIRAVSNQERVMMARVR